MFHKIIFVLNLQVLPMSYYLGKINKNECLVNRGEYWQTFNVNLVYHNLYIWEEYLRNKNRI